MLEVYQVIVKEYGYEYDASLDAQLWDKTKGLTTREALWGAICLRSGRDALKTIAREHELTTVLMPALSCDSMILPFEMYGHKVVYYRLTDSYKIDLDYFEKFVPNQKTLFLYMDYFGVPVITDDGLSHLREKNPEMIFIEDRTHNLIWEKKRSFVPDYTVASLRKWINIPDGGLLWTDKHLGKNDFAEDTTFADIRLQAQCMRREFFATGNPDTKNEYRKIFSTVSDIIDADREPSRMSEYSYQLALQADWNVIRQKRKENAERLISILEEANVDYIQPKSGNSDLYVPFKVSGRDDKQRRLSHKGIFNTVIWPLSEEQRMTCPVARETEVRMLAAPCDQRYTLEDMDYIGNEMVRTFNE